MKHALLSMAFPTLSCMVGYLCLRVLLNRHTANRRGQSNIQSRLQPTRGHPRQNSGPGRQGCPPVTNTRWIHLGLHGPANPSTPTPPGLVAPGSGNGDFCPPPPPPPLPPAIPPTMTMMAVDEAQSSEEDNLPGSSFLDRLYAMIKSREFVMSVVCVEDSRLTSLPSPDLTEEMNAMASIAAVFFILLVQPQLLLMLTGCILRGGSYHVALDWGLVKDVGLAADLIFNNRISFTLFLFLLVSGRRMSTLLVDFFKQLFSCYCCGCCGGGGSSSSSSSWWRRLQRGFRGGRQLRPQSSRARFFPSSRVAVPERPQTGNPSSACWVAVLLSGGVSCVATLCVLGVVVVSVVTVVDVDAVVPAVTWA
ncbi:hypothetical protein ACOMHN_011800 [Nucella lapillus]